MRLSEFDYDLPSELIAQTPLSERDGSRLMVLHKDSGRIEHRKFTDLIEYLDPGDLLVMNDSRVIRARLFGRRTSGGRVEVLLVRPVEGTIWEALVRPARRMSLGTEVVFSEALRGKVVDTVEGGGRLIELFSELEIGRAIEAYGQVPLPPYIRSQIADPERYQTVYASEPGSVAAPTAGLHFTPRVFETLERAQVRTSFVTLHVGPGTFRPVKTENVEEHTMHGEHFWLNEATANSIERTRSSGKRVVAVGTTVTRTLESCTDESGVVRPQHGWTSLFIYPGYVFGAVDAMLTNFHLPKSSLLLMISAFAGRDVVFAAYKEAIEQRYRFFSFGDAMLII